MNYATYIFKLLCGTVIFHIVVANVQTDWASHKRLQIPYQWFHLNTGRLNSRLLR